MKQEGGSGDHPKWPTPIELLELDVDVRLADLWAEASGIEVWDLETAGAFMRAAYGKGYADALTDPESENLAENHGYKTPPRRQDLADH